MTKFNIKTYMLAVAAVPGLLIGSYAAPGVMMKRDEKPPPVLFAKGGPQPSDIALKGDINFRRSEKASIFSQAMIVTQHLSIDWTASMFEGYDGKGEDKNANATVRPFIPKTLKDLEKPYKTTKEDAMKLVGKMDEGDMMFGRSDPAPWWPYALLAGALEVDWGKARDDGGKVLPDTPVTGADLAAQALEVLTGFRGHSVSGDEVKDLEHILKYAQDVKTPMILELEEFDGLKETGNLRNKRWEKWVSVISFDADKKDLTYATSFYDGSVRKNDKGKPDTYDPDNIEGNNGVNQTVPLADLKIKSYAHLYSSDHRSGTRPSVDEPSSMTSSATPTAEKTSANEISTTSESNAATTGSPT